MEKEKLNFILILVFLCSFFLFNKGFTSSLKPPTTINLKISPPETYQKARERIADFIILNIILPPTIDRNNIKKQLFGKFCSTIEKELSTEKVKELSDYGTKLLKQKLPLSKIKFLILKELNSSSKISKTYKIRLILLTSIVIFSGVFLVYIIKKAKK